MTKETFDRIITEYQEVTGRLQKLHAFVSNEEKMKELDQINQDLLIAQMNAMGSYSSILRIRLGINNKPEFSDEKEAAPAEVESEKTSE